MSLKMPTRTDGASLYSFEVELDGESFQFTFYWSEREGCWYFDLADDQATLLIASRKVVLDMPLLARFRPYGTMPAGDLIAVDTSGADERPGLGDVGARVVLHYFTAAELYGG